MLKCLCDNSLVRNKKHGAVLYLNFPCAYGIRLQVNKLISRVMHLDCSDWFAQFRLSAHRP